MAASPAPRPAGKKRAPSHRLNGPEKEAVKAESDFIAANPKATLRVAALLSTLKSLDARRAETWTTARVQVNRPAPPPDGTDLYHQLTHLLSLASPNRSCAMYSSGLPREASSGARCVDRAQQEVADGLADDATSSNLGGGQRGS